MTYWNAPVAVTEQVVVVSVTTISTVAATCGVPAGLPVVQVGAAALVAGAVTSICEGVLDGSTNADPLPNLTCALPAVGRPIPEIVTGMLPRPPLGHGVTLPGHELFGFTPVITGFAI
jgi:hypothetical protein